MQNTIEAYLDIETTGLSSADCIVTVIGIYICCGEDEKVVQLVGKDISANNLLEALKDVNVIHTYNGSRFDLPFINDFLGVNLNQMFPHRDLMLDCWDKNLYGGLKSVECQLGIARQLRDMNGYEAIRLWWKYVNSFDMNALNKLLEYNKEDVINLKTLKAKLLDC
ncbi:MAG: ribonuclease H-like domain-containing protein [Dehalococcoidales bacterium]|nr:ribonuclease H-like domain-containing protein [Dehalococcoidales bacterium]